MKVVDNYLIFLNSRDRTSGTISDGTYLLPNLLTDIKPNQHIELLLIDMVVKYNFYNIQTYNQSCIVKISIGGVAQVPFTLSLPIGSYNIYEIRDKLQEDLTTQSPTSMTFTVTWDKNLSHFNFTATDTTGPIDYIRFDFTSPQQEDTNSEILGFDRGSIYSFTLNSATEAVGVSQNPTGIGGEEALIINSDLPSDNLYMENGATEYTYSPYLAKVFLATQPFSNIIYNTVADSYKVKLPNRYLNDLRIYITNENGRLINLQSNYQLTFNVNVYEDTSQELIDINEDTNELLKMMLVKIQELLNKN